MLDIVKDAIVNGIIGSVGATLAFVLVAFLRRVL